MRKRPFGVQFSTDGVVVIDPSRDNPVVPWLKLCMDKSWEHSVRLMRKILESGGLCSEAFIWENIKT